MKLYLAVTFDEYELPLHVCESVRELASETGVHRNTIYKAIERDSKNKRKKRTSYNMKFKVVNLKENSIYG